MQKGLVLRLDKIYIEVHFEETQFIDNTDSDAFGSLVRLYSGDNSTAFFKKVILMRNFALFVDSQFTKFFTFENVYIKSHNMRKSTDKALYPNCLCYFESTADYVFTNFSIDGAWSDIDVAGLKFHINNDLLYRAKNDVVTRINAGIIIYLNFTNCNFGFISSRNKNWMDSASGIALHSNIPMVVTFFNNSFIGNRNDKGATCMEVYGQNNLKLQFIKSVFMGNAADIGSACLELFILYVLFDECLFFNNSIARISSLVNEFTEGTTGGSLYIQKPI